MNSCWNKGEFLHFMNEIKDTGVTFISHGLTFDATFLFKYGFKMGKALCTLSLANRIQARNTALKDLVLEYDIAQPRKILSFITMISKAFDIDKDEAKKAIVSGKFSFADIDLTGIAGKMAVTYAINDAVWAEEIFYALRDEYDSILTGQESYLTEEEANPFARFDRS